jgi:hypothetical protein
MQACAVAAALHAAAAAAAAAAVTQVLTVEHPSAGVLLGQQCGRQKQFLQSLLLE